MTCWRRTRSSGTSAGTRDEGPNRLRKEVALSPEFQALWDRIKPKTTYRVEFETDDLVQRAVDAIQADGEDRGAEDPRRPRGRSTCDKAASPPQAMSVAEEQVDARRVPLPDILAYLQNETELTRSTLVRILKESGRLAEFFVNPQRFMDQVAGILKHELHRLLVDGIKYERSRRRRTGRRVGDGALQERGAGQLPHRAASRRSRSTSTSSTIRRSSGSSPSSSISARTSSCS